MLMFKRWNLMDLNGFNEKYYYFILFFLGVQNKCLALFGVKRLVMSMSRARTTCPN